MKNTANKFKNRFKYNLRSAKVTINLKAIKDNISVLKKVSLGSKLMAVIKADAYGHGLKKVAVYIEPLVDAFAVASMGEAVSLRKKGINKPIVLLQGFDSKVSLLTCLELKLSPVIHSKYQLELLKETKLKNLDVWLKIDTGMGRLGFSIDEFGSAYKKLQSIRGISNIQLMSHLSDADNKISAKTNHQQSLFNSYTGLLNKHRGLSNSAGIFNQINSEYEWVRPGIALYGVSPFEDTSAFDLGLKAVMTLSAPIIAIKKIKKGSTVGYDSTWLCPEDMTIGIVSIGYGDGYPRTVKNSYVIINGIKANIIGKVSMDMLVVDLRKKPVKIGQEVILWGNGLPVEKIAQCANTIPYELLCSASKVKHEYIK